MPNDCPHKASSTAKLSELRDGTCLPKEALARVCNRTGGNKLDLQSRSGEHPSVCRMRSVVPRPSVPMLRKPVTKADCGFASFLQGAGGRSVQVARFNRGVCWKLDEESFSTGHQQGNEPEHDWSPTHLASGAHGASLLKVWKWPEM
jgi:hypothetical protein